MPDDPKDLKIKITLQGDTAGADQAKAAIEQVKQQAGAAAFDPRSGLATPPPDLDARTIEGLTAKQQALKAVSEETAKYNVLLKELESQQIKTGEATGQITTKKQALRAVVRGLAMEIPLMGRAMAFFVSTTTAGIGIIAVLVNKLISTYRQLSAEGEKAFDALPVLKYVAAVKEGLAQANVSAAEHEQKLRDIATAEEPLNQQLQNQLELLREQARLKNESLSMDERIALAEIDLAAKQGKLSHEQAEVTKLAIQKDFAAKRRDAANAADEEEYNATLFAYNRAEQAKSKLAEDAAKARDEAERGARPERFAAQLAQEEQHLQELQKKNKETQDKLSGPSRFLLGGTEQQRLEAELAASQDEITRSQNQIRILQKAEQDAKAARIAAGKTVSETGAADTANATEARRLYDRLLQLSARMGVQAGFAPRTAAGEDKLNATQVAGVMADATNKANQEAARKAKENTDAFTRAIKEGHATTYQQMRELINAIQAANAKNLELEGQIKALRTNR